MRKRGMFFVALIGISSVQGSAQEVFIEDVATRMETYRQRSACINSIGNTENRITTPLHVALANRDSQAVLDFFSEMKRDDLDHVHVLGRTALHGAYHYDMEDVFSLLLDEEANPYQLDVHGMMVGHYAAREGKTSYLATLLMYGKDGSVHRGDQVCARGRTAVHYAAQEGQEAALDLLLQGGASSCVRDGEGKLPIDLIEEQLEAEQNTTKRYAYERCLQLLEQAEKLKKEQKEKE